MKPHTVLTTTVPCHFGKGGQHTVTIGGDENGKLVHISSDCDDLDPEVRAVADGLLASATPPDDGRGRPKKRKRKRADCCRSFVEDLVAAIGCAEQGNDATSIDYHRTGKWEGMAELAHSYWRRVSSATEDARDEADRARRNAAKADLRPEFCKRLQRRFRKRTGFKEMDVNVETEQDEHGNDAPVYPYRGLALRLRGEIVALHMKRGIWSVNEESDEDLSGVTKTSGIHVEAFRHDIDYHTRDDGKWMCPCCGSKTNRIEQHCKGNRHRKRFWDAIDNGLEAMNARLVREKQTGEQER